MPISSSIVSIDAFTLHLLSLLSSQGHCTKKIISTNYYHLPTYHSQVLPSSFPFNKPNKQSLLLQSLPGPGLSSLVDINAFTSHLLCFFLLTVNVQGNVASINSFILIVLDTGAAAALSKGSPQNTLT